jgi:hypothetical protein
MATTAARSSKKRLAGKRPATRTRPAASPRDAVSLLKADHREVAAWFAQFDKATAVTRKNDLADRICRALRVHITIEEELFYPAFLAATEQKDLHHEAEIEHEGAERLIADIEASDPRDDHFDARVTVLAEMITHHVKEEEQPGGMFAKARQSDMDLRALGVEMNARKNSLQNGRSPAPRRTRGKRGSMPAFNGERAAAYRS